MRILLFIVTLLSIITNSSLAQKKELFTLNFEFSKFNITAESAVRLDSFINAIPGRNIAMIQLDGHCDSKGNSMYNFALSLKRVDAVRHYFTAKNIKTSIPFEQNGFGKSNLLYTENTDEERSSNRRVEIMVILKKETNIYDSTKLKHEKSLTAIMEDTLTKTGSIISLPKMEFEPGTANLLTSSLPLLKELRRLLLNNPKLKISIEGHICCGSENSEQVKSGSPEYKYVSKLYGLSEQRAKKVWLYLTQNGISESRLSFKGFGSTHPIFPLPEKTEDERNTNRRVEIRIISK